MRTGNTQNLPSKHEALSSSLGTAKKKKLLREVGGKVRALLGLNLGRAVCS
jgi:hypothetical protein